MQWNVITVVAILLIKKSKSKLESAEKRVVVREEPASSSDAKLDNLIKTMERMMDKIFVTD